MTRMTWTTAALVAVTAGCGGAGLAELVPESKIAHLKGDAAGEIPAARKKVAEQEASLRQARTDRNASQASLRSAEDRHAKAVGDEASAKKALSAAEAAYDTGMDSAKRARDASIAAAGKAYADKAAALEAALARSKKTETGRIVAAERNQEVEDATKAWEQARLEERQVRIQLADAQLWAARAAYELAKFKALTKASGANSAESRERLASFQEQLRDREAKVAALQKDADAKSKESAEGKAELEKAMNHK